MRRTCEFYGAALVAIVIGGGAAMAEGPATTQAAATQPAGASSQPAVTLILPPTKPNEYLTQEQLVQAYRQKQFSLVATEATRILGNAKVAVGYDRFALQVLRGESFLQQRNFDMAEKVYASAVLDAPDADKKAVMTATTLMIHKRTGVKYMSWTTDERGVPIYPAGMKGKTPIALDIMDLSKREAVYRALCWDQAAAIRGTIQAMTAANGKLTLVDGALDDIDHFSALETAARGSQDETTRIKKDLAVAIQGALSSQLTSQKQRVGEIEKSAMDVIQVRQNVNNPNNSNSPIYDTRVNGVPVTPSSPSTRNPRTTPNPNDPNSTGDYELQVNQLRGLDQGAVKELEKISEGAGKVPRGVDEVVKRLGADPKMFEAVVKDAKYVKDSADGTIEHYKLLNLLR